MNNVERSCTKNIEFILIFFRPKRRPNRVQHRWIQSRRSFWRKITRGYGPGGPKISSRPNNGLRVHVHSLSEKIHPGLRWGSPNDFHGYHWTGLEKGKKCRTNGGSQTCGPALHPGNSIKIYKKIDHIQSRSTKIDFVHLWSTRKVDHIQLRSTKVYFVQLWSIKK